MIRQLLKQVGQSEQGGHYDRALDLCITAENLYPWQREISASRQRIHKLQTLLELMQRAVQFGDRQEAWALAREGYELNPYDTRFQDEVRQAERANKTGEVRAALERGRADQAAAIVSELMEEGIHVEGAERELWEMVTAIASSEEALVEGNYALAEDSLRAVARKHPVARRLWQRIRRARRLSEQGHQALDQTGDLNEAERCFRRVLADEINDEGAREGLRRVISSRVEKLRSDSEQALDRGDSSTALLQARRASREAPDDPELKTWLGTCEQLHSFLKSASRAYADGDRTTALTHWREAVQLYPSPAIVSLIEQVEQERSGFFWRLIDLLTGRRSRGAQADEGG